MLKFKFPIVTKVVLMVMIIATVLAFGCGTPSGSQTGEQTIKIGQIAWLGFPIGLDMANASELMAEMDNKNGGIDIGGQKYKVQVITYDSNSDQATATAAVNRLIFEDGVKFIISDGILFDACLPITEENKIVVSAITPSPEIMNPDYSYCYMTGYNWSLFTDIIGWYATKNPDKKTAFVAYPDAFSGHATEPGTKAAVVGFGMQYSEEFYPADSQDLSSLGTKVKNLNPDVFMATGGGPVLDGMAFKAVVQSGYKGGLLIPNSTPFGTLEQVMPLNMIEGLINGAWPVEFDPPTTDMAKAYKAAYVEKYGEWNGPEVQGSGCYAFIKEALKKVGSTDPEKVAAYINQNGLVYESPCGKGQMSKRPDLKNNRYVDSVISLPIKEIKGGKPVLIDTVDLATAVKYFEKAVTSR